MDQHCTSRPGEERLVLVLFGRRILSSVGNSETARGTLDVSSQSRYLPGCAFLVFFVPSEEALCFSCDS